MDERLKFLDPELKATHSRIDILETICQANTDRIEAISKHVSTAGGRRPRASHGEDICKKRYLFCVFSFFERSACVKFCVDFPYYILSILPSRKTFIVLASVRNPMQECQH